MPTYEYRCAKCGNDLEVYQTFSEEPLKKHVGCGGKLTKVLSPVGIVLKGSGFYKNDSGSGARSKARSESANGDSKSSDSNGSDSKSSDSKSTDSKSDSGSSGASSKSEKSSAASDKKNGSTSGRDSKNGAKKSPVKSS
jgi:putative FmdB family regulatory protein